jgi:hypothetical protein
MNPMMTFRCATHDVSADLTDPVWAEKVTRGDCPLCQGSQLRPKLVARPLDIETDLHGAGYCSCCGSYFEPPTAVAKRAGVVTADSSSSFAPGLNTIEPDGTRGKFDPRWYEVGGEKFGQLEDPDDEE